MSFLDDAAADLEDVFFDDFAVDATLAGQPVRVVFEAAGDQLAGITVDAPVCQIRTADLTTPLQGQLLVVPQGASFGNYQVQEHVPDGTGMSLLRLLRVA